jgi:hypothetical protein
MEGGQSAADGSVLGIEEFFLGSKDNITLVAGRINPETLNAIH